MPVQLVDMITGQPVVRELFWKEVASCDMKPFIVGVTRESDHLAAIEKWWRQCVEYIGCTDEKNLRYVRGRPLKAIVCSGSSTSSRAAKGSP